MTIAKVSKMYGITQDTLRYYERIGLIPNVRKNKSGFRDYTEHDCMWVEFAKCMRSAGLPIETLIQYVSLFQQGDSTIEARKALLMEQRDALIEKMEDMRKTIERLSGKIERYEQGLMKREHALMREEP